MNYRNDGELTALALALLVNGQPQETVARKTDIAPNYLSQYKLGTRALTPRAARSLANYLQLPEAVIAKGRISAAWMYAILERIGTFPKAEG